jgi:hypothetical protein
VRVDGKNMIHRFVHYTLVTILIWLDFLTLQYTSSSSLFVVTHACLVASSMIIVTHACIVANL